MANIELTLQKIANENTKKQFDWQERMSNTAHQREVADLKTAGLNPVLSSGGSGAPSYTTSVDSAVNALGNIGATRISSAAQLKAAKLSANAMIAAAQAQASAAKYAADMHYASTRFATLNQRASNGWAIIDKVGTALANNSLFQKKAKSALSSLSSIKAPEQMFVQTNKTVTKDNFQLTSFYSSRLNNVLRQFGVTPTYKNKVLFAKAYNWSDKSAQTQFAKLIKYGSKPW